MRSLCPGSLVSSPASVTTLLPTGLGRVSASAPERQAGSLLQAQAGDVVPPLSLSPGVRTWSGTFLPNLRPGSWEMGWVQAFLCGDVLTDARRPGMQTHPGSLFLILMTRDSHRIGLCHCGHHV